MDDLQGLATRLAEDRVLLATACCRFAQRLPLLAHMVEGGKTPVQSADELGRRDFRIVIFPGGTARAVAHTLVAYHASLREHGSTTPWPGQMHIRASAGRSAERLLDGSEPEQAQRQRPVAHAG